MARRTMGVVAGMVVVLAAWPAGAFEPDAAAEPETPSAWYGWQTLSVDGACLGLTAVAIGAGRADVGALLGAAGYVLGGPIVHFSHGNANRGLASLGLRLSAPLVAFGVAAVATQDCNGDSCGLGGAMVWALATGVLGLGSIVVDAAALAHDPPSPLRIASLTITPTAAIDGKRTVLGLQGVF